MASVPSFLQHAPVLRGLRGMGDRHLARYLGELGVTATEQEACRLLNRTVSAANLRRPFSIATFYTVATGGIPSDSSGRASRTSGSSGFTGFPRKAGEECRE
ncbi:Bifunctional lysine-specific demethylase and histidyl-hydroxylase NO66, partial [Durusdinium trenchii]